jgi:tRNA (guanine37-N1)-methyltransferase
MTFRASVLTLYPDMFPGPLGASLAGRALDDGIWSLEATNIRDFATDKHRSVDDTPAGGGWRGPSQARRCAQLPCRNPRSP